MTDFHSASDSDQEFFQEVGASEAHFCGCASDSDSSSGSSKPGLELRSPAQLPESRESGSGPCTFEQNTEDRLDPVDILFDRIVRERTLELSNLQSATRPVTRSSARDTLSQLFNARADDRETQALSDPTDALFQRIVRERNLELSNLQFATRPVTGSSARDNLTQFFNRASGQQTTGEEERNVHQDVESLLQQSLVTSALRRNAFRSRLEQTLSSRLGGASLAVPIVSYLNRPQRLSPQATSGTSTPTAASTVDDFETASVASSDAGSEILQLQRAVQAGVDLLSETIQEDIHQLHHLHIVNSALESEFRNELERMVEARVAEVGGGDAVQQFIRNLPPAPRPTPVPVPAAFPRTPRQRPIQEQTRGASRPMSLSERINVTSEIDSLKKQVEEMKQMLQISFELQMDTQRAIRQEVSAVFGAFMQQWMASQTGASSGGPQVARPTQSSPRPTAPVSAGSCVICLDSSVDSVLYQCGHMCLCHACGIRLKAEGHTCPICRAPIRDVLRAYQTQ